MELWDPLLNFASPWLCIKWGSLSRAENKFPHKLPEIEFAAILDHLEKAKALILYKVTLLMDNVSELWVKAFKKGEVGEF